MISLHIVVDNAPPERLDRALQYLVRTQQKSVNIAGGAQLDRTMQFVERVRKELPNIVIQWRLLEDTGIIMRLTPDQWFARYVAPRIAWLKDNKIVTVVDNETSGSDAEINEYVSRSIAVANLLHSVNLNGAFCRFATGNLDDGSKRSNQYPLLKPLLQKLYTNDWISPNEYSNLSPRPSGGHLARYKLIEAVAGQTLNMSIGEAGILINYEARHGFVGTVSGKDMAAQLLSEEIWYRGGSIPRHVYLIGGYDEWQLCRITDDALEFWEDYYAKHPIQPPIAVQPVPAPTPAPIPTPAPAPTPEPVPPVLPAVEMVSIPLKVLQNIRQILQKDADTVGRLGVQLATLREDISAELELVDALVQKAIENEGKPSNGNSPVPAAVKPVDGVGS